MPGETSLVGGDVTWDNVANANVQPFQVMSVDASNSSTQITAALIAPASGTPVPIGVAYDQAKLDMSGNPVTGSGVSIRYLGIARVVADGAVTAGAFVKPSTTTAGRVTPATKAIAGAQPLPVVGIALKAAQNAGDQILVLLTPGGMF
jgi:hypothetical protein